jgi:hypothetical protein
LGLLVYALALSWLAPDIKRRGVDLGRRLFRSVGARRAAGSPALTTR